MMELHIKTQILIIEEEINLSNHKLYDLNKEYDICPNREWGLVPIQNKIQVLKSHLSNLYQKHSDLQKELNRHHLPKLKLKGTGSCPI